MIKVINAFAIAVALTACNKGVSHLGMGNVSSSSSDDDVSSVVRTYDDSIIQQKRDKIASVAKSYLGDTYWAYDKKKDNFPVNSWKCNKFVHDVLMEAGIAPPTKRDATGTWPIRAEDWASSNWIKNWKYKGASQDWQPGDIIAKKLAQPDAKASGHCGIAISDWQVVSACREEVEISISDEYLPQGGSTVRRFTDQ